jgi:glutamine amidotransferase PdxT
MMVEVHHNNKEIEGLVFKGESTLYKELVRKKAFLKALRAFYSILEVITT